MAKKSASKKARKSKDAAEKPLRKAKKAPARAGKKQSAKANGKGNGNGPRLTNKDRILRAWEDSSQLWPPELGDKLRLFVPKDLRGKMVKVIAVGSERAKGSTRLAPRDKARILFKPRNGEPVQFAVAQSDVFPREVTLKDLQAIQ